MLMNKKISIKELPFLLCSFFIPLLLFYITSSSSLMFDDAAEFALIIKLGSISHPPGHPAFIFFGMIWERVTSFFGVSTIASLTFLSSFCISYAALLMYLTFRRIGIELALQDNNSILKINLISCITSLIFATGSTTWVWGNTIEVYSFQVLAMSIALYGLVHFNFEKKNKFLLIAGMGLALGLSNHHLTMILFLPFVPLFFLKNFFIYEILKKKTKVKVYKENILIQLRNILYEKNIWLLITITSTFVVFFYGWMFIRAQNEYAFMFGKPDTLSNLIYHIKGGPYSQYITNKSDTLISERLPYFFYLTMNQYLLFFLLVIGGIVILVKKKLYRLISMIGIYFFMVFYYQLNNNQASSTDAYMLLPFFILTFLIFYFIYMYFDKFKLGIFLPIILIGQIIYNYPNHDRKSYPVSKSMMHILDISAPKNSVIVINTWSTLIQYYYYRIVENFRPDLIVLKGDIKSTYYRLFPNMYPEFYKKIQPQYDAYINELGKEHPEELNNTGSTLSTDKLKKMFGILVRSAETVAKEQHRAFLTDPRAHIVYTKEKFYDYHIFVSGCFSSSIPGDSLIESEFLKMDAPFLKSPMLLSDPAAYETLIDFEAVLDWHMQYYESIHDSTNMYLTDDAQRKLLTLERKMKEKIPFLKID